MATASTIFAAFNSLPASVRATAILAGGALRAIYDNTEVKDYDLFFRNEIDYTAAWDSLFAAGWVELPEKGSYGTATFRSPKGLEFNLVGFVFASPEEHLKLFDFRCCRMALYEPLVGRLTFTVERGAVDDAVGKVLTVLSNNGEARTIRRIEHYMEDYGYRLSEPEVSPAEYVRRIPVAPRGGGGYGC